MTKLLQERLYGLSVAVLLLLAALTSSVYFWRCDLTGTGQFTISGTTRSILSELTDTMYLTYYRSERLKPYLPAVGEIEDLLLEYQAQSNGKVRVQVLDPQSAGQLQDMERLGIQGNPLQVIEENQQSVAVVYTGLLLQYLDRQAVVPLLEKSETLEFEVTSRILQLATNKTPTIAFLSGEKERSLQQGFTLLSRVLNEGARVISVELGQEWSPDWDVVVVLGQKDLTDADVFQLDQHLARGGRAFIGVEGLALNLNSFDPAQVVTDASVFPLASRMSSWGLSVKPLMVADVFAKVIQTQAPQGFTFKRYPLWFDIHPQAVNTQHPITNRFGNLALLWASPLEWTPRPGLEATRLFHSSDRAWGMASAWTIDPDQALLRYQMESAGNTRAYDLAWAVEGLFPGAFEAPPAGFSALPADQRQASRMVVVGDSDFASDFVRNVNALTNFDFLTAALAWLGQDDRLVEIKTRPLRDRSLTALSDPAARSAAALNLVLINLVGVPVLLALLAAWFLLRRRKQVQAGAKEA